MPRIQVRANMERRSPDQQVDVDMKARRRAVLAAIQSDPPTRGLKPSDPAKLICDDRRR
jgi:hypothetical protein